MGLSAVDKLIKMECVWECLLKKIITRRTYKQTVKTLKYLLKKCQHYIAQTQGTQEEVMFIVLAGICRAITLTIEWPGYSSFTYKGFMYTQEMNIPTFRRLEHLISLPVRHVEQMHFTVTFSQESHCTVSGVVHCLSMSQHYTMGAAIWYWPTL